MTDLAGRPSARCAIHRSYTGLSSGHSNLDRAFQCELSHGQDVPTHSAQIKVDGNESLFQGTGRSDVTSTAGEGHGPMPLSIAGGHEYSCDMFIQESIAYFDKMMRPLSLKVKNAIDLSEADLDLSQEESELLGILLLHWGSNINRQP